MSIRPNVLMGRGEMVETNSGSTIDNYVLRDPLLIYKARFFRELSSMKSSPIRKIQSFCANTQSCKPKPL